jgi:hypothetical protein
MQEALGCKNYESNRRSRLLRHRVQAAHGVRGMHHIDLHCSGNHWLACVDGWRFEDIVRKSQDVTSKNGLANESGGH